MGDWVYVKLQPHIQQSVYPRSNRKLSFKYFGPYLIIQRIGAVAYKLQLPATSKVHLVFHVSQLKQALPPGTEVTDDTQLHCVLTQPPPSSCKVIASRLCKIGHSVKPHVLLQWDSWPSSWTVWENGNRLIGASDSATTPARGRPGT